MKREAVGMPRARVTSNGRVTIPKPVRDALRLRPGDEVDFEVRNGAIVGRVRRRPNIMDLFARLPGIDQAAYDPDAEDDAARRAAIIEERTTLCR